MPLGRSDAEALCEAIEKLPGQRDLRHQNQTLPAAPDVLGNGLEIDLGLAGTGDAVDQRHRKSAVGDARTQRLGGGALGVAEIRRRVGGIGRTRDRCRRQRQSLQRSLVDQCVDHPDADASLLGGFALLARKSIRPAGRERVAVPRSCARGGGPRRRTPRRTRSGPRCVPMRRHMRSTVPRAVSV